MHAALDAARLGQANCQADHNDAHSQQQLNARDEDFVTIRLMKTSVPNTDGCKDPWASCSLSALLQAFSCVTLRDG